MRFESKIEVINGRFQGGGGGGSVGRFGLMGRAPSQAADGVICLSGAPHLTIENKKSIMMTIAKSSF